MTSCIKIQTIQLLINVIENIAKRKKKYLQTSQLGAINLLFFSPNGIFCRHLAQGQSAVGTVVTSQLIVSKYTFFFMF